MLCVLFYLALFCLLTPVFCILLYNSLILLIFLICGQNLFVFSLKMPHQWGGVRQHGAREGEAAKASTFGFDASASRAGFEHRPFTVFSAPLAERGVKPCLSALICSLLFPHKGNALRSKAEMGEWKAMRQACLYKRLSVPHRHERALLLSVLCASSEAGVRRVVC
jgi:hypothetical protein